MSRPLIFQGLRFSRSLSDDFSAVSAGCIYHYRPSLLKRMARAFWRVWA